MLDPLLHVRPYEFLIRPWRSFPDYVAPLPVAPRPAEGEVRRRPPVSDVGFRVSKVELEFPRIEPNCLYGLDDRIPLHFIEPHEPQRNEGLGRGTLLNTRACHVVSAPRDSGWLIADRLCCD